MSIAQTPPETQARTSSGPAHPPDTPADVSQDSGGTPPGLCPVPAAFRLPCPECGAEVVFPFDSLLSAKLDQLLDLEQRLQALTCAREEVAV